MKKSPLTAIKLALHGMDPRSQKTMELFLKGPCRGVAVVSSETDAEIDVIDADFPTAGEILQQRRELTPERPIILLSLERVRIDNTYFVQKPVTAEQMLDTLDKIKPKPPQEAQPVATPPSEPDSPPKATEPANQEANPAVEPAVKSEPPPPKRRSALQMNEGGYTSFLGTLTDIDFNDPEQLLQASYDPKHFFLGFVDSAYKVARAEGRALQLQSMWKPLLIFPDTQQIWLDADEKQTRVLAGMEQSKLLSNNVGLIPFDAETVRTLKSADKFQDMDAFLWKLALWTSKGRFPAGLDIKRPVFLKCWPNFTRLLIIPDALRIAALLAQGPRAPMDIIKVLNVRPEYVFAFISAGFSLGIIGQTTRRADELVAQDPPKTVKKPGLLGKILHKLRGG